MAEVRQTTCQSKHQLAREFYAHNASGENTMVNVQGKLIPAHSVAINQILDLPENQPSIYQLMEALEDVDYNDIKDALCLKDTKWNTTGRNPGAFSRPNLLLEAKLWNTMVKRNLMPTSHNQTVDRKRLVLIHCIISDTKFNMGEVIARELSEACRNDKGILAFPCLVSALYRHHGVPTYNNDEYTDFCTGWDQAPAPAPAPVTSTHEEPAESEPITQHAAHQRSTSTASTAHGSFAATPPIPLATNPPSPAPTTETPPLYILQLCSQIQRIEARQVEFIAESKVFQTTLLRFLYDNFPTAKFQPAQHTPPTTPATANFAATPSTGTGETEKVHYSSNAEPDAFDWHTPYATQPPSPPTPVSAPAPLADLAESSGAQKRKAPAARVIREGTPLDHLPTHLQLLTLLPNHLLPRDDDASTSSLATAREKRTKVKMAVMILPPPNLWLSSFTLIFYDSCLSFCLIHVMH
ncbi:hypothetical protein V6N11_068200 [Hibiscus sabdariffa]|uniref:Putative plant transposon protein domain-containing protein n=1 Tax=Hibiscus sabdariffa TaxID=183260 RepID=A0ABR2ST11_9ROSI